MYLTIKLSMWYFMILLNVGNLCKWTGVMGHITNISLIPALGQLLYISVMLCGLFILFSNSPIAVIVYFVLVAASSITSTVSVHRYIRKNPSTWKVFYQ